MTTLYDKIEKIRDFINVCEWDSNAARLKYALSTRLMRIRNCGFYTDNEAKICEVKIQYKDIDDEGFYIEEVYYLYPKKETSLEKLTLAGLERRCQHRSSWTAPEFFEIIRRAGFDPSGKTEDAYLDLLWTAGRMLDIQMCRESAQNNSTSHTLIFCCFCRTVLLFSDTVRHHSQIPADPIRSFLHIFQSAHSAHFCLFRKHPMDCRFC